MPSYAEEIRNSFHSTLARTSEQAYGLQLEKAEGSWVWDVSGRKYLDLVAGISVANVGHRHPAVIEAIHSQSARYLHTMVYGEYIQDVQVRLGRKLTALLPEKLNCVNLVNSGTEAKEAALKLAKRHTGRTKIVTFHASYHGSTHGSLRVTGNVEKKFAFRPLLPDVHFLPFNSTDGLEKIDGRTACVIVEPVQGDAGVRIASRDFLEGLRKACDRSGALLIYDEIQSGMGRTGKMFAFEHCAVAPDIITLAKALGGGLPVGAMIAPQGIMKDFTTAPALGHITTFGGNPLSCAASLAAIEILEKEGLVQTAGAKGRRFAELLKHKEILEVRQIGLMLAVDLGSSGKLGRLIELCREEGVIIYRFLSHPYSFRISPPLTISEQEIERGVGIILSCLDRL